MATLTTYRRTLAPLLGVYEQGTATAASSSVTQLVCTSSLESGASLLSSAFSESLFNGKWLYMPGAAADDRSRLIKTSGGYEPSEGALLVDRAWGADPDTLDDRTFEITSLFSGTDLNALINKALKKCWVVREFTFTVSHANIRRHNLATGQTWLKDWRWVYQLGHLATGESRVGTSTIQQTDPFSRRKTGKLYNRPDGVWIEGPSWLTTDTVYVLAACPAYDLCRATSGGTFGDVSGLSGEAYESPAAEEWVAWRAILEAKDMLDHLEREGVATKEALQARAMAHARAVALGKMYFQPPERTMVPLVSIAPSLGASWA